MTEDGKVRRNAPRPALVNRIQNTWPSITHPTLADLYAPLTKPADLVKTHADRDRADDASYRPQTFTPRQRVGFLFALYGRYTAPLLPTEKNGRRRTGVNRQITDHEIA